MPEETLPPEYATLKGEPSLEERDRLHEAELILVLDSETFPFLGLRDVTRDVPLIVVSEPGRSTGFRKSIGPFDRVISPGEAEGRRMASVVQRILSESGDISEARRAKTVHRVASEAVGGVLDAFSASIESEPQVFEVLAKDALSLVPNLDGDHERCTVEDISSEVLPDSGFDAGVCAGLLRRTDADSRMRVIAEAWRTVKPGGRIVFVEDFVFDRESVSTSPTGVSTFVEEVRRATSGRVTLDFMRSLRYPPDEMYRAAIFSFLRL